MSLTGTLEVVGYGTRQLYEWNGNPEDRAAARAAFEKAMADGLTLATVADTERTSTQVRSFDEIEKVEKERGVVSARVSAPLIGG